MGVAVGRRVVGELKDEGGERDGGGGEGDIESTSDRNGATKSRIT